MKPDYRLPLPSVVDPETRRCVTLFIPDDIGHITAFWGWLRGIARAHTWANDPQNTARDVAQVWKDVYFDARMRWDGRQCGAVGATIEMQLRQNGCVLEYSIDCENWITLYDPRLCDELGTQPGPQDTPDIGECRTWQFSMQGNDALLLPVLVDQGYTIEITAASGGWNDGSTIFTWYCPDGKIFSAGNCAGGEQTNGSDPLPTAFHMQIVGRLEGGDFFDPMHGAWTVPNGTNQKFVLFQANDSDLSNNSGSVHFTVRVCGLVAENPYAAGVYIWEPGMPGWTIETGTVVGDHVLADANGDIIVSFAFDNEEAFTTASPGCRHDEQFPAQGTRTLDYYPVVNGQQQSACAHLVEFHGVEGWQTVAYRCSGSGPMNRLRFALHCNDSYEAKNFEVNVA